MQAGLGVCGFGMGHLIFMEARDCGEAGLLGTEGSAPPGKWLVLLISFIFSAVLCVPHSGRLVEIGI